MLYLFYLPNKKKEFKQNNGIRMSNLFFSSGNSIEVYMIKM